MITLLASITGFISSIFPDILKYFNDQKDKKHELAILDKQIEVQKAGTSGRLEEITAIAPLSETNSLYTTYKTGVRWVDALNGTVRPVLAYAFFALYSCVKYLQYLVIYSNEPLSIYIGQLWTTDDQAIFAGIISFYFGQRAISKLRGNGK
jgi:hypothetical protein